MGGIGSGGRNRLSEEEKKRRGTFRQGLSDAILDERAASRVIAGPWLSEIPEPELPLNEVGRKKYDELTRLLFDNNKLTVVTRMQAEVAARIFQKIAGLVAQGKDPTASDFTQLNRALDSLKIAENAKPIASPGEKTNKFSGSGFANRRNAAVRLRRSSAAGS